MVDKEGLAPPGDLAGADAATAPSAAARAADSLRYLICEVSTHASVGGVADKSEREAMLALCQRAGVLFERLQAIIDWADFALRNPDEFDSHGVRNLDGPVFDSARAAIAKATGQ